MTMDDRMAEILRRVTIALEELNAGQVKLGTAIQTLADGQRLAVNALRAMEDGQERAEAAVQAMVDRQKHMVELVTQLQIEMATLVEKG